MKSLTYITLFIFLAGILMAQKNSDIHEKFEFKGDIEDKAFNFDVKNNVENLSFFVEGRIVTGSLKLEILDPNGKREGGFELESSGKGSNSNVNVNSNVNSNSGGRGSTVTSSSSSSSSNSESGSGSNSNGGYSYSYKGSGQGSARGSMNKNITKPVEGMWSVKISALKTDGNLEVKITQE